MMGNNFQDKNEPPALEQYRKTTDGHASMSGVTSPSFMCRRCKTLRRCAGRKMIVKGVPKYGYVCAVCLRRVH